MPSKTPPSIHVIAGVNGAGKSSIQGAAILEAGGSYYNPDEAARKLMTANRILTQTEANSIAWHDGVELLRKAIQEKLDFVFESTLGGATIPILLSRAAAQGIADHVWFVGLESPRCTLRACWSGSVAAVISFLKKIFAAVTNAAGWISLTSFPSWRA